MARSDFKIAIVCALKDESSAVRAIFDETWDASRWGKALNDPNTYTPGRIGQHNVVLAYLPAMAGLATGTLTAHLLHSYPSLCLALVVGICGGAPIGEESSPLRLGDVVVSENVVQYTYARRFPDRQRRKDTLEDSLSRPNSEIRSFLHMLKTIPERKLLRQRMLQSLEDMLEKDDYVGWKRPIEEKLFQSTYRHKHQEQGVCETCDQCIQGRDEVCEFALKATCVELGCSDSWLEARSGARDWPEVHFGRVASGDQVMKSAIDRDTIVKEEQVIAFEMEGAGAWENIPTIIVKSICDYADSHKNKDWQKYASCVAACCAKAMLSVWAVTDATNILAERPFHIPFFIEAKRVPTFIGRADEIAELERTLNPDSTNISSRRIFVAHGMGGIGKTQLALNFAYMQKERFDTTIWLDGSSNSSLRKSFASFASRLCRAGKIANTHSEGDSDKIVQDVLTWLSLPDNRHWLMIFDNVDRDHLAEEEDEQAYDVENFFPEADHGAILITTRLDGPFRFGRERKIEEVENEDALQILETTMGRPIRVHEDAQQTLQKLQGLPLALNLAGSYIRDVGISLTEYDRHYERKWHSLMKSQERYRLREYADRSMLTTWLVSLEQVTRESSDAANLLELWSFFSNNGLSFKMLFDARRHLEKYLEVPDWLLRVTEDELTFAEAVRPLIRYSLIRKLDDTGKYSVHNVLHEWCFDRAQHLDEGEQARKSCGLASAIVASLVPMEEEESKFWQTQRDLFPHAVKAYQRIQRCLGDTIDEYWQLYLPVQAMYRLGRLFSSMTELGMAQRTYLVALAGCQTALGSEHTLTLEIVNSLGIVYWEQDKLDKAEDMYLRALAGYEKTPGDKNIGALYALNNLGILYDKRDQEDKAEQMYLRALTGYENLVGPENVATLDAVNNLGILYWRQEKLRKAQDMFVRALTGYEKFYGNEHVATLGTVGNLGMIFYFQGKVDEAEKLLERSLAVHERLFGREHLSTLAAAHDLGLIYANHLKQEKAEEIWKWVLVGREKALGVEHTSTMITVLNLAKLYRGQGKLNDAEKMCKRAVAGYEKALGASHSSTLMANEEYSAIQKAMHNMFEPTATSSNGYQHDISEAIAALHTKDQCETSGLATLPLMDCRSGAKKSWRLIHNTIVATRK